MNKKVIPKEIKRAINVIRKNKKLIEDRRDELATIGDVEDMIKEALCKTLS